MKYLFSQSYICRPYLLSFVACQGLCMKNLYFWELHYINCILFFAEKVLKCSVSVRSVIWDAEFDSACDPLNNVVPMLDTNTINLCAQKSWLVINGRGYGSRVLILRKSPHEETQSKLWGDSAWPYVDSKPLMSLAVQEWSKINAPYN